MAVGRIFPIPNPTREFPIDPINHGDTGRDTPLPFIIGVGASSTIETSYQISFIIQRYIVRVNPDDQGGGGGGVAVTCSPVSNLYCVPQAVVTKVASPTATVRCAQ